MARVSRSAGCCLVVIDRSLSDVAEKPLTTETLVGSAQLQDLLWSFIHGMRARVVDAQHAGVMLSQYGRLDQSFDAAMPSLVEVLQEEGLYNKDSEMVTHVAAQALQQVSQ